MSPDVTCVDQIRAVNPTLNARAQHLSTCQVTGPHTRFDLPADVTIKHSPTGFLRTILPYKEDGLSAHQMSLYLTLILGLPMPPIPTLNGTCPCGHPYCIMGTHQLNCKKWAGKSWTKGHNCLVKAVAFEIRRLGLGAVDSDHTI